ncbi:UTP:RNA uridylyltransferase 1 [Vigna radiata var. radiata]|uniref:RNA uridylyltransferase n=2 Tax=Vigna TaxID=3913 RepID=A0A1S3VX60_VIGRR|nr:UTP:RNA uridylyltransferase 1 [Vigna radiata var. radiata]
MNGGGGDLPLPPTPSNGGEFLLSLIQRPHHHHHQHPRQQSPAIDPAVAVVGPTIPVGSPQWPIAGADHPHALPLPHHLPPWSHTLSSPLYPPNFFGLPHNPFPPPRNHFPVTPNSVTNGVNVNAGLTHDLRKLGFPIEEKNSKVDGFVQQQELKLQFGSLPTVAYSASEVSPNVDSLLNLKFNRGYNGFDRNLHVDQPSSNSSGNVVLQGNHDVVDRERRGLEGYTASGSFSHEASRVPPGFGNRNRGKGLEGRKDGRVGGGEMGGGGGRIENLYGKREGVRMVSGERSNVRGNVVREMGLADQLDRPGPPAGSNLHSSGVNETGGSGANVDVLGEKLADSLLIEDDSDDRTNSRQRRATREKDARSSDSRGQQILSQRARMYKRQLVCRRDIDVLNVPFLAIYESLIPPEEEKQKQKQLMALLERLVSKEWPAAKLYLYGSCANSFGVSKSDIDVCLAIEEADMDKAKIIMKLADILQSDNLQNVQALTRARVPIVKLMDPVTGISCDICINNLLAVVNTKLLRDYALIDPRLRQLAFIIKHWAKSRRVNETYHGTLSSYAYVLMCIHYLQMRRPAILPCLQEMETTYSVTVDDINCAFFDKVEKLGDFGRQNKETIAQLVRGFFHYWAYCHDYANSVISVRTGSIISKREKDWTRRIGNDRHLICIEDPFETSHDLGRVVDKYSIKVLREEFERAAEIMQNDPNPCIKLFEPYVPS